MRRLLVLAVLLVAVAPVHAQDFPAPGEGVFTWERVGDRPLNAFVLGFSPGGRLLAARDTVFTFEPGTSGPLSGRWLGRSRPGGFVEALLALDPAGDTLFVGHGNGALLSRSVNGGVTWTLVNGSLSGTVIGGPDEPDGFHVVPPSHAYAGRLLAGGVILYSDDRGATWLDAAQDIPTNSQSSARTFAVLPSGRVLAGTGGGVLGSDDGGTSYLRTPLHGSFVIYALVPLSTPGSTQSGAPACGLADPALCDGAIAVGYSSQLPHARAWRTADGGRTWAESIALPEPEDGVSNGYTAGVVGLGVGPDGLGRAVAVLGRGVVYATADGGQSWVAVGRMPVFSIEHRTQQARLGPDGHLWVTTSLIGTGWEWVYRSAEPATAAFPVVAESGPEIGAARLIVRPNPSNGAVSVSVALAFPVSSATVTILDALGRQVARLHDGPLGAGTHALGVDASALAPGVYTVRAATGGTVTTALVTVVR